MKELVKKNTILPVGAVTNSWNLRVKAIKYCELDCIVIISSYCTQPLFPKGMAIILVLNRKYKE